MVKRLTLKCNKECRNSYLSKLHRKGANHFKMHGAAIKNGNKQTKQNNTDRHVNNYTLIRYNLLGIKHMIIK